MKKITVVIPCYNEADGIGAVIGGFDKDRLAELGYQLEILVIDNNSKDHTADIARSMGARVIFEPKPGKGNAVITAFYNISEDTDYIVMLDGDNTYKPAELLRLIEPLESNFSDVVIGSRLYGNISKQAMSRLHWFGNSAFSILVQLLYRVKVTDTFTGYFAWRREVLVKLRPHLVSRGFTLEMEMVTKMARMGYDICSVPITYAPDAGESSLRTFYDGSRILLVLLRQLRWSPKINKIAFVADAIYPYNMGGKEKRLYEISKRLVKDGREVHIYTMKWWDGPKVIQQDGVYLHGIARLRPLYKEDRRSIGEAIIFSLNCLKLIREPFDVIDVDSMPFFPIFTVRLVAWLKGKKLHATWHEVWGAAYWQSYLGRGGRLAALIESVAMRLPDVIISNSDHTTKLLRRAGLKQTIITVPLGVDADNIYTIPPSIVTSDVIFIGRLLSHKNADKLVEAVSLVRQDYPHIRCLIVGEGPERKAIENIVAQLGLEANVQLMNFIEDHNELYGLMKSSKMLVLPSEREGFGIVVIEANFCGLPVITTSHQHNAARDLIIEGQNGLLVELDPQRLADAIKTMLTNQNMQPAKALQSKGDFTWQGAADKIDKILGSEAKA
ncbi:MAG TPA: glycosyltransferase [Candidatus Acidoferrum sp.]|nr:glycosyltransferase [Candidatus Acidoferrum sp.]